MEGMDPFLQFLHMTALGYILSFALGICALLIFAIAAMDSSQRTAVAFARRGGRRRAPKHKSKSGACKV